MLFGRVGVDRNVVVPGEPPASDLDPPDALPDPVDPLPGAGLGKSLGEFGEGLPEAFDDGALPGKAAEARLPAVVRTRLLEMHVPVRRGADAYGVFGVEVPGAFVADDRVLIPPPAQPTRTLLGGDAAVRHHRGAARGIKGVEHRPQGGQRTVGALVPRSVRAGPSAAAPPSK